MSRRCTYHVLRCDSSDKAHPVQSIAKNDPAMYWQTTGPMKEATVTIEFDKPCIIDSFELEVRLIGDYDKEDLLLLLSPAEAKEANSSGKFRRKNISHALLLPASSKVAHKLRLICTQPFADIPIGLKSLTVFGELPSKTQPPASSLSPSSPMPTTPPHSAGAEKKGTAVGSTLSALLMTEEDDDAATSPAARSGFLFFEKKAKGDVIIRDERKAPATAMPVAPSAIPPPKPLGDDAPMAPKSVPKPRAKPSPAAAAAKKEKQAEAEKKKDEIKRSLSLEDAMVEPKRARIDAPSPAPAAASPAKKPLNKAMSMQMPTPLSRLLEGVVLVISGIENPERAKLRDLAMQMGAMYRPQWDRQCTHLVAEFPDTPKVREAQSMHAIIVTADWLRDCFAQKRRLSAENYKLGPRRQQQAVLAQTFPDDSDEILPDSPAYAPKRLVPLAAGAKKAKAAEGGDGDSTDRDDLYLADDATVAIGGDEVQRRWQTFSGRHAKAGAQQKPAAASKAVVEGDPEVEQPKGELARYLSIGSLQNFLSGVKIYLWGDFDAAEKKLLRRYAAAYDGDVIDDVAEATHVIVSSPSLKAPPNKRPEAPLLKPAWLHKCHEEQRRMPEKDFRLV